MFKNYLERMFVNWAARQGSRQSVKAFAKYLGFEEATVQKWLERDRGRPSAANVKKLSYTLGLEVYDAVGMQRPDPHLHYLDAHWEEFSDDKRRRIREFAEGYGASEKGRKK